MKKGQVREGIVRDVKFPNKGNVELLPLKDREEGTAPGNVRGRNLCGGSVCNGNFHNKNGFCG